MALVRRRWRGVMVRYMNGSKFRREEAAHMLTRGRVGGSMEQAYGTSAARVVAPHANVVIAEEWPAAAAAAALSICSAIEAR